MTPENAKGTIQELSDTLQKKISGLSKYAETSNAPTLGSVLDGVSSLASDVDLRKSMQEIIARHVPPGTDPSVVASAAKNVGKELSGPGFSVEGPVYFGVPIGYGYFKADTTRSTGPSSKASAIGAGVPATLMMVGPALIPAGVISDIASPAAGAIVAHDGESSAVSVTVAARPYLDTGVIGAAGVATAKAGLRLGGFDLTAEGGWRGQESVVGGTRATKQSFTGDYLSMQQARQDAKAGYDENVKKTEAGVFAPDLKPPEVLSSPRPNSEFYFLLGASKKF